MRSGLTRLLLLLGFAVALVAVGPAPSLPVGAAAQQAPAPAPAAAEEPKRPENPQALLDGWKVEIDQIAAGAQRQNLTDRQLADLRARAENVRGRAAGLADQLTPTVQAIEARLKQLGPGPQQPKEGEPAPTPESDAVKQDREVQNKALAELQGFVKQASLIQLKADEVVRSIGDRRRDRFTRALLEQTSSIVDPTLWLEAAAALPGTLRAFGFLMRDWFGLLGSRGGSVAFAALALALAFFAVLVRPVRGRLVFMTVRSPDVADPPALKEAAAAAGIFFVNTVLPLVGLASIYLVLDFFDLSPDSIDQMQIGLMIAVGMGAAIYSLALGILAPAKPQWRLLIVSDQAAHRLMRLFTVLAITFGFGLFVVRMLPVLAAPLPLVIALNGLFALVDIVLMILCLRTVAASLASTEETVEFAVPGPVDPTPPAENRHSILWRWLVPVAWLAALTGIAAGIAGFVSLSRFIASEMLWAGLCLAALYVLLILVDETFGAVFRRETAVGSSLTRSMGFGRETVEQLGVVFSGVSRLALIGLMALLVLWPLGFSSEDLVADAKAAFFGFKVGGITVSISTILLALATFVVAIAVTRGIQTWLGVRFLPKTRLDAGLKNSILTAFGYTGTILAAMLAFSTVGLNLENIAIVAGALSVGIGFGLQSIVNNFVSGLILLAERPIKSGDMIEIGGEKGFVRKINVRSTEIETFDRASLIVPNSSLISGNVKNWMHRDLTGRVTVNVGVAYDADPEKVREILLAAAKAHKLVMLFPAPSAFFTNFGESALEFRLVATVPNVTDAFGVESDLRYEIVKRLRSAGIEIPYAQRDLHVRQLDDLRKLAEDFLQGPRLVPRPVPEARPDGG
ncbi:DUF3772 domain-containing protein [Prosthecomicrobium sp. N25]|uniref:DUF3772 domain-containing protein n=1 Tax=Prosthecomicrobium sp. N25 TaxID=3129254 RepID=UPI0030777E2D